MVGGRMKGLTSQPTKVSFRANKNRWITMLPLTGAVLSLLYTLMSYPCAGKKAPLYEIIPGQGLYKLHQKKSNWMSAWSTCLEEDAHLLIVNSKKEADGIVRIMKDNNVFEVFIGFHEDTTSPERSYVTVDGTAASVVRI
uniref:C-type lectin domain-containing protein n=1 Tax=Timema cristinae TaxID=61476 RepID=A0A7R9H7K2_TIMCR|nr:unnamed protein product [Timema cristinae]